MKLRPAWAVYPSPKGKREKLTKKETSASVVAWGLPGGKWTTTQKRQVAKGGPES